MKKPKEKTPKGIDRESDIITPLAETLHIERDHAEDMLNKLNKLKGLDDIEALSFILEHFELCLRTSLMSAPLAANYDRLSGKNLGWAVGLIEQYKDEMPLGIYAMVKREVDAFVKAFLTPTVWAKYYQDRFQELKPVKTTRA